MRLIYAAIVGLISTWPVAATAVPNPPAPSQTIEVSDKLASTYAHHDLKGYERLFAPGVHVYQNGVLVASNRDQWMARIEKDLKDHGGLK